MIRSALHIDLAGIRRIALGSELFSAEDIAVVDTMMQDYFECEKARGHECFLLQKGDVDVGVIYLQPVKATIGAWQNTMIAVDKAAQGRGHGSELMMHSESFLRDKDARILLVETSGDAEFSRTRTFYEKLGYAKEARVRDYYMDGMDMVMYRKALGVKA